MGRHLHSRDDHLASWIQVHPYDYPYYFLTLVCDSSIVAQKCTFDVVTWYLHFFPYIYYILSIFNIYVCLSFLYISYRCMLGFVILVGLPILPVITWAFLLISFTLLWQVCAFTSYSQFARIACPYLVGLWFDMTRWPWEIRLKGIAETNPSIGNLSLSYHCLALRRGKWVEWIMPNLAKWPGDIG